MLYLSILLNDSTSLQALVIILLLHIPLYTTDKRLIKCILN